MVAALGAGAGTVLGFAPFSLFPIAVVSLAILIETLHRGSPRSGFWRGYAFGLGLLGFGVFWIRISLNEFGNMDPWLANLLMVLFVAAMALYYGLMGWLTRRLASGPPWVPPLLLLPGLYVLLEWLRGWLFTGFPWLNLGYTQIQGPLAGFAPIAGVYGLSLLTALSGGLLWGLVRWGGSARVWAGAGLVALWLSGAGLQRLEWTEPAGEPFAATVVQANIPQATKWDPDARLAIMETYVDLTLAHLDSDLILWPETAIPDFLHEVRGVLIEPLAERARREGIEIALGIPVLEEETGRYYNGLVSIGSREDLYAKRHLVPFGEFMPFKSWLGPLAHAFEVPMSDFSRGDRAQPLLRVGNRIAGASICYEDAFPAELIQALPEAQFLINVSNDAWFGDSLAPHQHLEIARMRALETGRYLVRATNTGISAIIDHLGRVLVDVPSFVRGAVTTAVTPRSGATPYVLVGNRLAIGLALVLVLAAVAVGSRRA
ncbi:MAG: apolipoprotein N-acyltransferase [Chromatiaceae bacterium]|jgi:apolipoprotein N-acyltransferase